MGKYYKQGAEAPAHAQKPHAKAEKGEHYKAEHEGLAVCEKCNALYYKKAWHADTGEIPEEYRDEPVHFALCPADDMIKKGLFEGEIRISGIPEQFRQELRNLIENFGKEEARRDPTHRVIEITEDAADMRVTTTENQMASKLARKIEHAFHVADTKITHSEEPYQVDRAYIQFQKEV